MAKQCEACSGLPQSGGKSLGAVRVRNILVGGRLVYLCDAHAEAVQALNPRHVDDIRRLLKEASGHRSLVERRSAVNRRVFPPRPEGPR